VHAATIAANKIPLTSIAVLRLGIVSFLMGSGRTAGAA
jgi:hypothetical protein